jgi:hypothetical protein
LRNTTVTIVKLLLMSSAEGLLLFFVEDAIVISVSIPLSDDGLALDMITGNHWSAIALGTRLRRDATHYVS